MSKAYDVISLLVNEGVSREAVTSVAQQMAKILANVSGDYDSGADGFIIVEIDSECWKIDFYDDSYTSGYCSGMTKVKPVEKTITVWE